MRKGFISTPLLGTIIFLTALVFVVNLSLSERNAVSQVTVNAYDNRMVSLIDTYNLDAATQMTNSIKASVEGFLGHGCWSSAFTIPAHDNKTDYNLTYDRWYFCNQVLSLIKSIACTQTSSTNCYYSNGSSCNPNSNGCSCNINSFINTYGLQQELAYLAETHNFESFNIYSTNAENLSNLISSSGDYQSFCKAILGDPLFDCNGFAAGVFECCANAPINNTHYNGSPECAPSASDENYIYGCENGTFYFLLNLTDKKVYKNLPRVGANDSSGNVLNSNVLAYANPYFYINYPLFKYFNATYTVVQTVINDLNFSRCKYNSANPNPPSVTCQTSQLSSSKVANDINNSLNSYNFLLNFTIGGTGGTNFQCAGSDCTGNFTKFFSSGTSYFNASSQNMPVQTNDSTPLYVVDLNQPNAFCMLIDWSNAFSYVGS